MTAILVMDNGAITKVNKSIGRDGKKDALYVTITDGISEFDMSAPLLKHEKILKDVLQRGRLTVQLEGRIYSGASGSKQLLTMADYELQLPTEKKSG